MRGLSSLLAIAWVALFSACGASSGSPRTPTSPPGIAPPQPSVVLSVVATSDLHGTIDRTPVFGGYVDNLREVRGGDGAVLLVDAGDMFQGTIAANQTEGAAVIRAYNALGYHAATLGNHEFDYGPVGPAATPVSASDDRRGALLAAAELAQFPLLASNFIDKASGQPVQWPGILPCTIVELADVRVGIVGASSSETLETTIAANVDDLQMAPAAETINQHARQLRAQGAAVVIAAVHAGGKCARFDDPDDTSSCEPSELFEVAEALDADLVDVLVGAHTHQGVAHRVHGIPVIQSYAYGTAFGRVDLAVDAVSGQVEVLRIYPPHRVCQEKSRESTTCTPGRYEGAPVEASAAVAKAIDRDVANARAKRAEPVGVTLEAPLSRRGRPSSPLGDRVAAWMLEVRPHAEAAIINAGGLRTDLPQGPLSYGAFYEMFPFDNRFASTKVKGGALKKLIRTSLEAGDGFALAGLQVRASCKQGKLHVDLQKSGRSLHDDEDVVLLMSDYMAMTKRVAEAGMPREHFDFEADPAIREALVQHLRNKGGTIPAARPSPMSVPDSWPVTCN